MKRLLLIPAVLIAFGISGCARPDDPGTGNVPTPPPQAAPDLTPYIAQLQDGIIEFCGWQIQGNIAATLLSAVGVPYVGMVPALVKQACDAFGRKGARRGATASPVMNVKGHRIVLRDSVKVR